MVVSIAVYIATTDILLLVKPTYHQLKNQHIVNSLNAEFV